MTPEDAVRELAVSTAEAMTSVLEMFCPGATSHRPPEIAADAADALKSPPVPGIAASVAYVDGVTGGNVFLLSRDGAKRLAGAMMGVPIDAPLEEGELSEIEHSAAGEAMNQMMAAAAAATSRVLGYEVEIAPPLITPTGAGDLAEAFEGTAYATTTGFEVCGEGCRFVQLVPNAFVVRMTRALDERSVEVAPVDRPVDDDTRGALRASLTATSMRVSAEIGRTRLPVDRLIAMPAGTVIELDHEADEPVEIFVNGRRFALGRLILTEDDDWAVRVERVLADNEQEAGRKGG